MNINNPTTFSTPDLTLSTSNSSGTAGALRADDTLLVYDTTLPTAVAYGGSSVAGDTATAARRNHTHSGPAAATNDICAQVRSTANQSISNATNTTITYDAEVFDTDSMADLGTNDERLTIKTAGKYLIIFNCAFASNATGYREAFLYLNGDTATQVTTIPATSGRRTSCGLAWVQSFSVDDYIQVQVSQNSGGALNVETVNPASANLTAIRLSF